VRMRTKDGWTVTQESVKCGKKGCKKCPHGPYFYGYKKVDGKMQKRYFGKIKPDVIHKDEETPKKTTKAKAKSAGQSKGGKAGNGMGGKNGSKATQEGKREARGNKTQTPPPPKKPQAGKASPKKEVKKPHPHDVIFNKGTANGKVACEILGILPAVFETMTKDHLDKVYRDLLKLHHPDRGGDKEVCSRINEAYSYLKRLVRGS